MSKQTARRASSPAIIGISTGKRVEEERRPLSDEVSSTVQEQLEHHRERVAVAAYFRAERRGFAGGDPVEDWLEAERELDATVQRNDLSASD